MRYLFLILPLISGCSIYSEALDMAEKNPGKEICFTLYNKTDHPKHFCVIQK